MKDTKIMISKTDFYNLYNRNSLNNKNRNVGDWANKLYRRNIGLVIAYNLAKLGISANSVTVAHLIIAIIASCIFIAPSIFTLLFVILVFEFVYVLDNVDGQLARFHGTFSKYGDLLDTFSDIFIGAFFAMAFGVRLYTYSHNFLFIILGNLGSISYVFEGLWVKNLNEILGGYTSENSESLTYKIRTYLLKIENISLIISIVFVLTLLQKLFISINLLKWFFVFYVFLLFLTKIFLRYYLLLIKANKAKKIVWKGWDKEI